RDLAGKTPQKKENDYQLEFEEASLITIGICYEERPRFSGGAYHPLFRRSDEFLDLPMPKALAERQRRARAILELDDVVSSQVAALRERGLVSPYLRNFVLARCNPLRFKRGATMPWDELVEKVTAAAKKLDT